MKYSEGDYLSVQIGQVDLSMHYRWPGSWETSSKTWSKNKLNEYDLYGK